MMLRTSLNKTNPALQMFSLTVRKNFGLFILTVIIMLLVCPGYMLINLNEFKSLYPGEETVYLVENWITAVSSSCAVAACIGVFIYNIINFSYLYSKKSSDVFHSLPLTRNEMLSSRGFAGLILTIVPAIIGFISLALLTVFNSAGHALLYMLLKSFVMVLLTAVCAWAFSLLFAVCAGSVFDYVLSFLGVNIGLVFISLIIYNFMSSMLIGYTYSNEYILSLLSPVYYCFSKLFYVLENGATLKMTLMFSLRILAVAAAFTALSFILYNRRKSEKAGSGYAFGFIYVICSFIAAFCGAAAFGIMFSENNIESPIYWIFSAAGSVITAVAFGAVSDRGFKTVKKSVLIGASALLATAVIAGCIKIDVFGYSKRIPNQKQVRYAQVHSFDSSVKYENTDKVVALHKKIIDLDSDAFLQNSKGYSCYESVRIEYKLKNGKTMKRNYFVDALQVQNELFDIYSSDERFKDIENRIINGKRVNLYFGCSYFGDGNEDEYRDGYITKNEFAAILDAYREELTDNRNIITDYSGYFSASVDDSNNSYCMMYIDDSFKNTLRLINDLKFEERE